MDESKNAMLPPAAYVNFLRVAQRQSELFLVFGQVAQDQRAAAHVLSSFVASPAHAKAMLRTLAEAIERYEERFGAIPEVEPPTASPAAKASGAAAKAPPLRRKRGSS